MQNTLSRVWFLSKGCKLVPTEYTRGRVRWAHPDGYFLNEQGRIVLHNLSPCQQTCGHGHPVPMQRECAKTCHLLMALAHHGERPTFTDKNGKTYVGIVHHLNSDLLDYKPANLLCWLTREQHYEADRRQRALRKRVPDLHAFTYERLRELQDPRTMPREEFEKQLALIPVFTIDPDCDRREPNKHYDPFIERS